MNAFRLQERLWGCLAHVPLITIIWGSYFLYFNYNNLSWEMLMTCFKLPQTASLPITPIILTLCSIPISLSIMFFKKKSAFVRNNAKSAYTFNLWLIKAYIFAFAGTAIGLLLCFVWLSFACSTLVFIISLFSLQQSLIGVATALHGKIYHYWYPF